MKTNGVRYCPGYKNPYRAIIMVGRRELHLGSFSSYAEAYKVYKEAIAHIKPKGRRSANDRKWF